MVTGEGAIGRELEFLFQLRPTAVVLEYVVDAGDAVVTGGDDLVAGLLAVVDERDVAQGLGRMRGAGEDEGAR